MMTNNHDLLEGGISELTGEISALRKEFHEYSKIFTKVMFLFGLGGIGIAISLICIIILLSILYGC